jgi:hypothetical protein
MGRGDALEIVGVVADSKYYSLRETDKPTVYLFSIASSERIGLTLSVRTAGDPLTISDAIRRDVQSVAPAVPVVRVRTLASQVDRSLGTERLVAQLITAFAVLALVLASVGLYGVLGYSVARRTSEIGLRLALGATRPAVLRSVLHFGRCAGRDRALTVPRNPALRSQSLGCACCRGRRGVHARRGNGGRTAARMARLPRRAAGGPAPRMRRRP